MLKFLLSRYLIRFERTWSFDTSFMREILAVNTGSFMKVLLGTGAADAKAVPPEATLAATFAGVLSEDCGACTQLGVDMASANGVNVEVLRAILAGDEAGMGESASLSWRFARANLARDMDACAPLREEIVRRWGESGLISISLSLTASHIFPMLKYALGHGRACSKVMVAGTAVAPPRGHTEKPPDCAITNPNADFRAWMPDAS